MIFVAVIQTRPDMIRPLPRSTDQDPNQVQTSSLSPHKLNTHLCICELKLTSRRCQDS